jgi:hypothetical protein
VKMLYKRNSKVCIALVIVVVLASFVGYVGWSMFHLISNAASFRDTLQKDGFTIIQATGAHFDFLWLPPPTSISCQNQTEFINEARSLNTTGRLLGGNFIYQLDIFHFYAVTPDTNFAYEYTLPNPSFLDPMLIGVSYLVDFVPILWPVLIIVILMAIALLIAQITEKGEPAQRVRFFLLSAYSAMSNGITIGSRNSKYAE